jgi:hypothetical protein
MKKTEKRAVCDLCERDKRTAELHCEKHSIDLCTRHIRAHFDAAACRLIPVKREPTPEEKAREALEHISTKYRTV